VETPLTIARLMPSIDFHSYPPRQWPRDFVALQSGRNFSILALSGGGAAGAFGAGAVAGLTRSGSRPDFCGRDRGQRRRAGALTRFLDLRGMRRFSRLHQWHRRNLLQPRGLRRALRSSVYRGAPLKRLVDSHLSDVMIQAVAREDGQGRLLLVAKTDVATGEPVV